MTTRDVYDGIGDYDRMVTCIASEENIRRFLKMFLNDDNFIILEKALAAGDAERAFYGAHTLKGLCQNLCLTNLYEVDFMMTEALRGGDIEQARELFPRLKERYDEVVLKIADMDE